ncbi:hypothetical protein [uncultured Anaerococcus sp.]|uniref:hypothetical protein n=1 Tax=uncultured Anaerococcus sp. TaxID=293428 RepID=UPI0028896960|nr:hypothetical protein [uncultured Anaerococcus sp.]
MTDDILNQVKSAEESADKELDLAKEQALKLIEEAKIKADESYKDEVNRAKIKAKKLIEEAKLKALEKSKPVLEKAREEAEEIKKIDLDKVSKTVDSLVERIVNNGDS